MSACTADGRDGRKRTGPPRGYTPDLRLGADGCTWDFGRFFAQVDKAATSGCWIWTGSTAGRRGNLYGQYAGKGGAHRAAYRILVGSIQAGMELDHLCRNPLCVNPEHLEPVTRAENARRRWALITHCVNGHEFTPKNTYFYAQRVCRTCHSERAKARRAAARLAVAS